MKKYKVRYLRKTQTETESILWGYLRDRRLAGYKFRRQYPIGSYILDFYCPKARLGIELDGGHHALPEIAEYDRIRTLHIESYGIKIIRFWNSEVKNNLDGVLETIYNNLTRA